MLLSDQSPGAKIGQKSAAVVNITNGKLIRAVLTATPMHHYFYYLCHLERHTQLCRNRSLQESGQALSHDLKSVRPKYAIGLAKNNEQLIRQHMKNKTILQGTWTQDSHGG